MSDEFLYFQDLKIGDEFGPSVYQLTQKTITKYVEAVEDTSPMYVDSKQAKALGFESAVAPPAIAAIFFMDAVGKAFPNRPPGGIHSKQLFNFISAPKPGDILLTKLKIVDKYLKKAMKYVIIEGGTERQDGTLICLGRLTVIWSQ